LLVKLFALGAVLLRLTSDASHEVRGHGSDSDGREDIMERGDELGFDNFDSNVIDETFQGNLSSTQESISQGSVEVGAGCAGEIVDLVVSLHAVQSFGTRKAGYVRFRTFHEGCHKRAEIMALVKIYRLKGRDSEEFF
jgi:hypothetical protein